MVVFSPDYLLLVNGAPQYRRKFLDNAISRIKKDYLGYLNQYERILNQRNSILKKYYNKSSLMDTLDVWDLQMSKIGTIINIFRNDYLNKLEKYTKYIYSDITNKSEDFNIKYINTIFPEDRIAEKYDDDDINFYFESLKNSRDADLKLGYTSVGIHRDDIDIRINGKEAKIYASQGQQRSAALTFKLAEAKLLQKYSGKNPIILLDDVMSELDSIRQEYILNQIKNNQVFLTCCDILNTLKMKQGNIYNIKNGEILS